jgi:hypothetical protein
VKNYRLDEKAGFVMRRAGSESEAQEDLEMIMEKGDCLFDLINPEKDYVWELTQDDWKEYKVHVDIKDGHDGLYSLIYARCSPGLR